MPTPFTHLEIAQRLLDDDALPAATRAALHAERGAFLLGNVAADARVEAGTDRADTHFYTYALPIIQAPWRVMVERYPTLLQPHDPAHRAFVAGYVAHLSVDEHWAKHLTGPEFIKRDWADRWEQFYMLHILLITMDERDLNRLQSWQPQALATASPQGWLPFISDDSLTKWRTLIYDQIKPDGHSQTLTIFGGRINKTPEEMRAIVDTPATIQQRLWDHVPQQTVQAVEAGMYRYAREQMQVYWSESA